VGAAAAGALTLSVSTPASAAIVTLLTVVGIRSRRGALLLGAASLTALAVALGLVVVQQHRNRWPADFGWPTMFDRSHRLSLVGVALLVVTVAVTSTPRRASGSVSRPADHLG
jgi:formate hydrogenlyase subunit 3/multisubunit Na+/H+ antiporter MnhD subunit